MRGCSQEVKQELFYGEENPFADDGEEASPFTVMRGKFAKMKREL